MEYVDHDLFRIFVLVNVCLLRLLRMGLRLRWCSSFLRVTCSIRLLLCCELCFCSWNYTSDINIGCLGLLSRLYSCFGIFSHIPNDSELIKSYPTIALVTSDPQIILLIIGVIGVNLLTKLAKIIITIILIAWFTQEPIFSMLNFGS